MSLKKIRVLPDQYIFHQDESGNTAYLVISGGLVAELNGKKVGKIESGEIFGELSLILNEKRTCSVKAVIPTEIVEIRKVRFRTIGDATCTGAIESESNTLDKIIAEVAAAHQTERGSREDDRRTETSMEDRKKEGYF